MPLPIDLPLSEWCWLGKFVVNFNHFLRRVEDGQGETVSLIVQLTEVNGTDLSDVLAAGFVLDASGRKLPEWKSEVDSLRFRFTGATGSRVYEFLYAHHASLPAGEAVKLIISGFGAKLDPCARNAVIYGNDGVRCRLWPAGLTQPCPGETVDLPFNSRESLLQDEELRLDIKGEASSRALQTLSEAQPDQATLDAYNPEQRSLPVTEAQSNSNSQAVKSEPSLQLSEGLDIQSVTEAGTMEADRADTPPTTQTNAHWFETPTSQPPQPNYSVPSVASAYNHTQASTHSRSFEKATKTALEDARDIDDDAPDTIALLAQAEAGGLKQGFICPEIVQKPRNSQQQLHETPCLSHNGHHVPRVQKLRAPGLTSFSRTRVTNLADCRIGSISYKFLSIVHDSSAPKLTNTGEAFSQQIVLLDRTGYLRTMLFAPQCAELELIHQGQVLLIESIQVQLWADPNDARQGLGNNSRWRFCGLASPSAQQVSNGGEYCLSGTLLPSEEEYDRLQSLWHWYHLDGGASKAQHLYPHATLRPLRKVCDIRWNGVKSDFFDILVELLDFYPPSSPKHPATLYVTDYTINEFTRATYDQHLGYEVSEYAKRASMCDQPGGGWVLSVALWDMQIHALAAIYKGQYLLIRGLRSVWNGPYGISVSVGGQGDYNLKIGEGSQHSQLDQLLARKQAWQVGREQELRMRFRAEEANEAAWIEAHGGEHSVCLTNSRTLATDPETSQQSRGEHALQATNSLLSLKHPSAFIPAEARDQSIIGTGREVKSSSQCRMKNEAPLESQKMHRAILALTFRERFGENHRNCEEQPSDLVRAEERSELINLDSSQIITPPNGPVAADLHHKPSKPHSLQFPSIVLDSELDLISPEIIKGHSNWSQVLDAPRCGKLPQAHLVSYMPKDPRDWLRTVEGKVVFTLALLLVAETSPGEDNGQVTVDQCVPVVVSGLAACLFFDIDSERLEIVDEQEALIREVYASVRALMGFTMDKGARPDEFVDRSEVDTSQNRGDQHKLFPGYLIDDRNLDAPSWRQLRARPSYDWGLSIWRSRKSGQNIISVYSCHLKAPEQRIA